MKNSSRRLLYRSFDGGLSPEQCLECLRGFSQVLQKNPSLGHEVRSVCVWDIPETDVGGLEDIFKILLDQTPNLRCLVVPSYRQFTKSLNNLLKDNNFLGQLRIFDSRMAGSTDLSSLQWWCPIFRLRQLSYISLANCEDWNHNNIPPEVQISGGLSVRRIEIEASILRYSTLARLIRNCKRLETFRYDGSPSFYHGDSDPATIIRALSLHQDSLKQLHLDCPSKGEDQNFDQVPKLESLENFLSLEKLYVTQSSLPRCPLLPPSLKVLDIDSRFEPLEPELFHNLGIASHSSLKALSELYIDLFEFEDYPEGIFDSFNSRQLRSISSPERGMKDEIDKAP
ncbi:hypothetical protein BJX96DRAFT_165879 [Aspergillus floccosus]